MRIGFSWKISLKLPPGPLVSKPIAPEAATEPPDAEDEAEHARTEPTVGVDGETAAPGLGACR